jgi:uncharacterized protein (TIGR03086 family)
MTTEALETSFATARRMLAGVRPDHLDQPTPCASWDVRELVNHLVGGTYYFAASVNDGTAPNGGDVPDFADGDILAAYDEGAAQAVAAFGADGAQDRMVTLPFGTMPVSAFMGLATTDQFVHAWDLARATGQEFDGDQAHAAALLEGSRMAIQDAFRGPDGQAPFGPATEVADDAPATDQLAAFLGRQA